MSDIESPTPRSAGLRVLVMDDDRDYADTTAQLLHLWGHQPGVAYDGLQALALGRIFRPDVALLDLAVPPMDGYQVARGLRAQLETQNTVLFAITGFASKKLKRRSRLKGFAQHLLKPVDPNVLQQLLSNISSASDFPELSSTPPPWRE
jgi:CheY-like chemotaxis protein